jgi:hypothetical protein
LSFALQQLGDGLEQFASSSSDLPEGITCQALDSINCISYLLVRFYALATDIPEAQQASFNVWEEYAQSMRNAGGWPFHMSSAVCLSYVTARHVQGLPSS